MSYHSFSYLDYKPAVQKFMEANIRLQDCYMAVTKEAFDAAPKGSMDGMCAREKNDVKSLLESNELAMTSLVRDRIGVLYAIEMKAQAIEKAKEQE